MTIAVIGGAGFVGTRLASVFTDAGTPYVILDKVLKGDQYVDVTDPETFRSLPNFDVVINLAAEHRDDVSPKSLYDLVNVEGAENVCQFCRNRQVSTIIFTSTVAVYGFAPEDTDETGEINYFNDYGRTKYLAEKKYREWHTEDPENRNLVIVRPTVIFGEANRGNVYNLMRQIASGQFVMIGNGNNKKSMAYVQNVAEFLYFSTSLRGYSLYNYIDKPDLDMNNLISIIRKNLFNKEDVGFRMPAWIGLIAGYIFDGLAFVVRKKLPLSSIRIKKFLGTTAFNSSCSKSGFTPSVKLEDGLKKTLEYEFIKKIRPNKIFYSE